MLGRKVFNIMFNDVICPPIHNMVVVTSPNGDHAPPELAEIIIIDTNHKRSFLSEISFWHNDVITIAVVRLSSIADRKKVNKLTSTSSFGFDFVFITFVIILKPLCVSTTSTIVIAPNKKKSMEEISPRLCSNNLSDNDTNSEERKNNTQHIIPVTKADAALSIFIRCSHAIAV